MTMTPDEYFYLFFQMYDMFYLDFLKQTNGDVKEAIQMLNDNQDLIFRVFNTTWDL